MYSFVNETVLELQTRSQENDPIHHESHYESSLLKEFRLINRELGFILGYLG